MQLRGWYFKKRNIVTLLIFLKALHWLPVKHRIIFKVLLITFKAIHGLAPSYISDLISVRSATGKYNLRTSNSLTIKYSSCKSLATLGDRSFHVATLNYGMIFRALLDTLICK